MVQMRARRQRAEMPSMAKIGSESTTPDEPGTPDGPLGRRSMVRRTLIWMFVAVVAMGGLLGFERDSTAKGVLLQDSSLVKHDDTPCTDDHGHEHKNCV